jgi:hypothetical protein
MSELDQKIHDETAKALYRALAIEHFWKHFGVWPFGGMLYCDCEIAERYRRIFQIPRPDPDYQFSEFDDE